MAIRFRVRLAIGVVMLAGLAGVSAQERMAPPGFETRLLLLDAVSTGERIIAAGERGFILLSDDGQRWRAASTIGTATLTALARQGTHVWAVGHDTTILKSADSGARWQRVHYAPEAQSPLLDIAFLNDQHGFAVGAYGTFLETRDAGAHWQARKISPQDLHYNAIAVLDSNTPLFAGETGSLLRSTDAGQNWQALASPYAGSWFGIVALDAKTAVLFGLRGKLYRTDDAGEHWTALPESTTAALMGGRVLDDGRVVVVGNDGVMLVSTDRARTFKAYQQSGNPALATMLANKRQWWLFGERGVMRVTASQ